jgi:hypothetical protein
MGSEMSPYSRSMLATFAAARIPSAYREYVPDYQTLLFRDSLCPVSFFGRAGGARYVVLNHGVKPNRAGPPAVRPDRFAAFRAIREIGVSGSQDSPAQPPTPIF